MANPFPFVASTVLEAAQLNGIGETVSFTPSWNNVTVGNGTLNYATYVRVQNLVYLQVHFTLGSTSAVTGNISINSPLPPANVNQNSVGVSMFVDSSAGTVFPGTCSMAAGLTQAIPTNTSGTYAFWQVAGATIPFTWAVGDAIIFNATYRMA